MITFFTIPKPFEGEIGTIQRNALASWTRVDPAAQVLVLGDETGAADAAAQIGAEHVPELPRNEHGTPLLDGAFRIAAERRRNELLCYVNTDILFPRSLADAARAAASLQRPFLVVGECWNVRVDDRVDPDTIDWSALLRRARKRGADAIDYFVYTPELYDDIPPFSVGRPAFDNWLVWKARDDGAAVVDATWTVKALHEDHTYAHAGSLSQRNTSPEAAENRRLTGGGRERLYSRFDATHRLTSHGLVPNPLGYRHAGETVRRAWAKLGYATGASPFVIRVGYIAGEPNPYRAPHLDRIAAHPDIDLAVIYAAPTVQRREWKLDYAHEPTFLRGPSLPLTRVLHHDYPLTPQVWGLLDRERFDVLVIGGWSLMAPQLAIIWARRRRVPYLIVSENHLREPRPAWVRALKSLVLRRVVPQASGLLVTGSLAREHALHYGARPDRITVFPNTVDIPAYRAAAERLRPQREEIRQRLGIAQDAVAVAQVGRLFPLKAPDETLEAVERARAFTKQPLHLLLVGDGELRPSLERRAKELGLDVTFAGFRQGAELLECFAATDVFALLSHRETWGVVVNEAAAFGLPLVLTDRVGAAGDLLRDGENGELVRSGDIESAARAIARLADDPELRERYGLRSLALVEPWDYERSIEAFVEAVRAAAADRRS